MVLVHLRPAGRAVNFGTGDMNEPLDLSPRLHNGVGDGLRAEHVGPEEGQAVEDRPGDMRLGGEVNDDVGLLPLVAAGDRTRRLVLFDVTSIPGIGPPATCRCGAPITTL